ncbi:MAG: type 1 glutamine amidotransferase [Acidimicrobiales bacterium]
MDRALVLRHHLEDSPGLVGEGFEARGYEIDVALIDESNVGPSLEDYDALVILGSKCAVYDLEEESPWFRRELALIADADARRIPILGICFGAQALCRQFGGTVRRARSEEIGWFDIDVLATVELPSGPWFEFHFDECLLPHEAELWATSARAVQAFAIGPHVGVQFHPEVDDAQLKEWLAADDEVRDLGLDLEALVEQTARETPAARVRARELVDLFLRRAG